MNTMPTTARTDERKAASTAAPAHDVAPSHQDTGVSLDCLALLGHDRPEPRDQLGGISLSADRPGDDDESHIL